MLNIPEILELTINIVIGVFKHSSTSLNYNFVESRILSYSIIFLKYAIILNIRTI